MNLLLHFNPVPKNEIFKYLQNISIIYLKAEIIQKFPRKSMNFNIFFLFY